MKLARAQLPEPGDPRQLMEALQDSGAELNQALGVLSRVSLAHRRRHLADRLAEGGQLVGIHGDRDLFFGSTVEPHQPRPAHGA